MKQVFTPRWLLTILTGCLFAAYSAYQVFIIFRDAPRGLSAEGIVISAIVALMFAILAVYLWTAGVKGKKHILFMIVRRTSFIIALLVLSVILIATTLFFSRDGIHTYSFEVGKPWLHSRLEANFQYDMAIQD